ncbi:MAG: helicase [Clostridia bacterium]|nr:helicase [Clostridia bacterium]
MNFLVSEMTIKRLCGDNAFKKGRAYYRAKKVKLQSYNEHSKIIEASVEGNSIFYVTVKQDKNGKIQGECTCPTLASFDKYCCQHVAAVLFYIKAHEILSLFENKAVRPSGHLLHFETREMVHVAFICRPVLYGDKGYLMGVQMRAGLKASHMIQDLRAFLDKIKIKESYECSEEFFYNPEFHSFQKEDDEVIERLIHLSESPFIYRPSFEEKDTLLIEPHNWETLLSRLVAAPLVKIQQEDDTLCDLILSNEPIPLTFEFKEADTGEYQLDVKGLNQVIALDSYGYVLTKGKMIKLPAEDCKRLVELKRMLNHEGRHELIIPSEQIDHFMETVTPGLAKLGKVQIASTVAERLIKTPLKAKLFLDRVKNKLLAGLEFHYGSVVLNPCEDWEQVLRYHPTLLREGDKELFLIKVMEESGFVKTEGRFYIENEDIEYQFLYHVMPTLESVVEIYATTAVKVRIHKSYVGPRIKVDVEDQTDWLAFSFDMQGTSESEIRKILLSLEEKRKFYRMPNGSLLSLETKAFQNINQFINEIGISGDEIDGEIRLPMNSGMQMIDLLEERNLVSKGPTLYRLMEQLHRPEELNFEIPKSLAPILRDYQKSGFQWLKMLAKHGFGGILADDMGLGKTIQSITYIVSILPEVRREKKPVLIVVPTALLYNWRNELKEFAPEIRTVIITGSRLKRHTALENLLGVDVVITSYPSLRMDFKIYLGKFFHTLFLDEAQAFKNASTQTAKTVKKIRADYRFALTGTPIENGLEELWSIFHVVFPKLLPRRIEFDRLTRENVAKRVRPFILRRLKKDVLQELPEKIESIQLSELSLEQKELYAAYLAELKQDAFKHLNEDSFYKNRIKILAGLTRLRQLCCHPALFVEGYQGGSAKFDQLMAILEECRVAGRRVLIFSQFTQMLSLIGRKLGYYGVPYFYLDGQTPPDERVALCSRFNEGEESLFLISLKAGGTGLNLTGADTVILYDLWWNPAVEQQAADRAYRMGQKKTVQVIKLIAKGTIEEKITQLQEKKKNLIGEIIPSEEDLLSIMTEQDIREILMNE